MAMTREQKEAVIIGFYLDGKTIQSCEIGQDKYRYIKLGFMPVWDFEKRLYRLKPEPVEGWFLVDRNGSLTLCDNLEQAEKKASHYDASCPYDKPHRVIYMRECDPPEGDK